MTEQAPTTPMPDQHDDPPRLALRPKDAAKALGISERLLWSLTNRGMVPHARAGRCVLYRLSDLDQWLVEQTKARK